MLTRLYVDNFRCLANVTIDFSPLTVLVGPNGSGKSSILHALRMVSDFLTQRNNSEELFPTESLTRWDIRSAQLFELDVRLPQENNEGILLPGGLYRYSLRLSHDRMREKNRVAEEKLNFEGKTLYRGWLDNSESGEAGTPTFRAHLFRDDGTEGAQVLGDWHYSGIARIGPRPENRLLQRFRRYIDRMVILSINPASVTAEARKEQSMVSFDGSDFAAWFLYLHHNHALACREAERSLQEGVLPGLALFQTESEGAIQVAKAIYQQKSSQIKVRLDELSAGQRAMVILEHALAVTRAWGSTIIIDEPANFVGLEEIQPLLLRLQNGADEHETQAVITSHHPVAYDLLAEQNGRWLERTPLGATQVSKVADLVDGSRETTIPLSELVARGFVSKQSHEPSAFDSKE